MVRRTRDEAAETRNSILDAAEHVFSKSGVSHTSLEDIATAAGVTRGAIYWHFKNKSELFNAMVNRVMLPIEEIVGRSADVDATDPLALLKDAAVGALKRTASDPQCRRVLDIITHKCEYLEEMVDVKERISHIKCGCVETTEKTIRNAIKRGQLPKNLDARLAAVGLDSMIYGLISNWLADPTYVKLERDAEALIDRYLSCLGAGQMPKSRIGRKTPAKRASKQLH
ncbi:MAG TPA: TetR family transcriptional regulator [Burkholderiales bacterium]|nr:TetR family transcriptional regulator [Burkholderiales bacterium]